MKSTVVFKDCGIALNYESTQSFPILFRFLLFDVWVKIFVAFLNLNSSNSFSAIQLKNNQFCVSMPSM